MGRDGHAPAPAVRPAGTRWWRPSAPPASRTRPRSPPPSRPKNQAAVAFNPQQLAEAEATLSAHLRELFDQPPKNLANDPNFAKCRADLLGVAVAIELARGQHNGAVEAYNAALESFPHDVAAVAFGFKPQPTFEATPAA